MRTTKAKQNRVKFWNGRIAAAKSDKERALVWQNACWKAASDAADEGRPEVWAALVSHLHDFYMRHGG